MKDLYSFTENEIKMLKAFYDESVDSCGACNEDGNMSYMNAQDLAEALNQSLQSVGGTMASLLEKGAISDCMESARGANINDFVVNHRIPLIEKWDTEEA